MTETLSPSDTTVAYPEVDTNDLNTFLDEQMRLTHIVSPFENDAIWTKNMSSLEIVNYARIHNLEVIALCGYKWVPKNDPKKYPACEECLKKARDLIRKHG